MVDKNGGFILWTHLLKYDLEIVMLKSGLKSGLKSWKWLKMHAKIRHLIPLSELKNDELYRQVPALCTTRPIRRLSPDFMSRAARSSIVPPRRALEAEPSWDEVGKKKDLLFCKKKWRLSLT